MTVKLRSQGRQVVLEGRDAILWWKELSNAKTPMGIQIQAANGKETDFKPIITLTLAPIEEKKQ